MRNIQYIGSLFTIVAAVAFVSATAQEPNTPQTIEREKMEGLWFTHTANAAGIQADSMAYFSQLSINYDKTKGSFKQAQSGKDNDSYGFSTDGGGKVASLKGMYMWGYFDYTRTKLRDAEYNASLIDPLRGMPYYIADQNKSNWIDQDYSLGMKVASPVLWRHWVAGLGVDYENAQGAKQLDPRPNIYLSKFTVTPSLTYQYRNHTIGGDFSYFTRREDGTAMNSTGFITQPVWEVVAPGFFTTGDIGGGLSGLRAYNANSLGGGLQYGFTHNNLKILLSGHYTHTVEDANNNYTTPKTIGTTKENIWQGKVNLIWDFNPSNAFFLNGEYFSRDLDGIEYIQVYDNTFEVAKWVVISKNVRSNYKTKQANFSLNYMNKSDKGGYHWLAGLDMNYEKLSEIYYIPRSTQDIKNFTAAAHVKKNFIFGKNALLVGARGSYKTNLSGSHTYTGLNAASKIYTDMVLRDYNYLCSDYYTLGGELSYTRSGIFKGKTALFASASGTYCKALDHKDLFGHRGFLNIKVGLSF